MNVQQRAPPKQLCASYVKAVLDRLALGDGAQASVLHTLGVKLDRALREAETLLHDRRELADPPAL
jgi:hypothetical protein